MLKGFVAVLAAAALAACWSCSRLGAMDAHVWSEVCWIVSLPRRSLKRWRQHQVPPPCLNREDEETLDNAFEDAETMGIDMGLDHAILDEDTCARRFMGMAHLQYSGPYRGVFGDSSPQLRCSMNYSGGSLLHMRSYKVLNARRLFRPHIVDAMGYGLATPNHFVFDITEACRDTLLGKQLYGSDLVGRDYITAWGFPPERVRTVIQLPYRMAMLVCLSAWDVIALDCRKKCLRSSRFYDHWRAIQENPEIPQDVLPARLAREDCNKTDEGHLFQRDMFTRMAQSLRGWTERIALGDLECRNLCASYVDWLDDCSAALLKDAAETWVYSKNLGRGGNWRESSRSHGSYAPLFLVHALIFSFSLRTTQKSIGTPNNALQTILRRALHCFAPELRSAIDNMIANIALPSAATMSRHKFIFDIVWMKTMADFHRCIVDDDALLFGMMDSSPQGGRNWLMSEYSGLRGRDLLDAARAAQAMAELANAPVRPDDLQWQLRVNADVLKDAFFTHVLPPSGLGSRHGSAAHKCHTWLHQHRLECFDWRSVRRMLLCYFSVAEDKGPEQKLGKIKTSAGAMFPWWIDIRFDDDGLIGLPPPDHDDVGDDADVRLDSTHIITVNGTYHLVELIQQSILAALGDFAEVKPLLESACYVFHHGYLRSRFTEVLVGDRLLWQLSFRSGPPLFEGGRAWGVLIKIATWFRERKVMIIAAWPRDPHSPKSNSVNSTLEVLYVSK